MIVTRIFRRIAGILSISSLVIFTAPTWAMPLTFEFTGTISNTVLIWGVEQTLATSHPQWNGLPVSGTLMIDLPALAASPLNGPGYSQYSKRSDTYPFADWMSFSIINPDGSILDISDSIPIIPPPESEGDDAYTQLAHQSYLYGDSGFYAQRTYSSIEQIPINHASLSLQATGENALWLTSSANYHDVIIKPEFANFENYGWVWQLNDLGLGHEYYFRIDSIVRKAIDVPEPPLLLMLISGLLLLQWKRHQFDI